MVTGELKRQIDAVWNDFWSGGISNPLEVMEQLTYLLFIKALDEQQTLAENKANRTGEPIEDDIFPEGQEFRPEGRAKGRLYGDLRWSRFKNRPAAEMFDIVENYVFPFLQVRAGESSHAKHMRDARFTIPTAALLEKAVDKLDAVEMQDRDTKGDVYEYMLSKIATAGQNGQFRTPRHIIELMVEMTVPQPDDVICDPASGTCGFLVGAGEYIRREHPSALTSPEQSKHFHNGMFSGYDFDNTMLRIGSMNMQLHGVQNPNIGYRDSLAEDYAGDAEAYSLILANPPFAGSLDYEGTAKDLLQVARTKKTELLFISLFLRMLKPGGRAAVIVPDGVLFGSTKAHKELRRILVEDRLSLDDKRDPLLSEFKLGALAGDLADDEHERNNLPDVLARWRERDRAELERAPTEQSFCVSKPDIAANDYDLSINRYKDFVFDEVEHPSPTGLLEELAALERQIRSGLDEIKALMRGPSSRVTMPEQ